MKINFQYNSAAQDILHFVVMIVKFILLLYSEVVLIFNIKLESEKSREQLVFRRVHVDLKVDGAV